MKLNDLLPSTFKYKDNEYKIDLAFDNVLDVFDVMKDDMLRDYEIAEMGLALLVDGPVNDNPVELWNFVFNEFIDSKEEKPIKYDLKGNPMPMEEEKQHIDMARDAQYIYASFRQAYNINLYDEQGKMHWYEFRSLLNGLPSDTIMQRIIQIRLWKPSKNDSSEYKETMKELQAIYDLEVE